MTSARILAPTRIGAELVLGEAAPRELGGMVAELAAWLGLELPPNVAPATDGQLAELVAGVAATLGLEPERPVLLVGRVGADGALEPDPASESALTAESLGARRLVLSERSSSPLLDCPSLAVFAVGTVGEALAVALPLREWLSSGDWLLAPSVGGLGHRLAREVLLNRAPRLLTWTQVAALAAGLLGRAPAAPLAAQLVLARDIARRHAGDPVLLEIPAAAELRDWPRPLRLELLAHAVQSAADASDAVVMRHVRRAREWLAPPGERHAEDLQVMGACGRALACVHQWELALEELSAALAGWQSLAAEDQSSYALCELLRLAGLRQDGQLYGRLLDGAVPALRRHPRTRPLALAFTELALGRAAVQLGDTDTARGALEPDERFADAPEHLRAARLRWLYRLELAQGAESAAARRIAALGRFPDTEQLELALLELALARGESLTEPLAALVGVPGHAPEIRRTWARLRAEAEATGVGADEGDLARRLVEVVRY